MADRYWVGPGAYWDNYGGEDNWSLTSGGSPGAAVPTSSDNVYFDANSGSGNVYISIATAAHAYCANLSFAGFTGTFGGYDSSNVLEVFGNLTLGSGMSFYTYMNTTQLKGTGSQTITTNGKTFPGPIYIQGNYTLQDALTVGTTYGGDYALRVTSGTFNTNNFALSTPDLYTTGGTLTLGSSTVTIRGSSAPSGYTFTLASGVTLNSGTSSLVFAANSSYSQELYIASPPATFYNVTANGLNGMSFIGNATFNNLTLNGSDGSYLQQSTFTLNGDLTVSNTLTISAASAPNLRTFIKSNLVGVQRAISAPSFTAGAAYCDFRDIAITGAAAPISGTSFGDCNRNSGITFSTPKTVYWVGGTGTFRTNSFAATSGGTAASANYPIAQDILIIDDNSGGAGISIGLYGYVGFAEYTHISGINASARTLTSFISASSTAIYKSFIVNSLASVSGGTLIFAGSTTQILNQNGATWSAGVLVWATGTVQLDSAFTTSDTGNLAVQLLQGTLNLNNYNMTLTGTNSGFYAYDLSGFYSKTLAMGTSTLLLTSTGGSGNYAFQGDSTLVVTGTGTISLTSASTKGFFGGSNKTYPTINQGGSGILTIYGNNSFADITNTYSATGATTVRFQGGRNNFFTNFNLTGSVGKVCTLASSSTARVGISKSSGLWYMGSNSTDAGNNSGLSFTSGGGIDYLSISYVNGITTQNGFLMF